MSLDFSQQYDAPIVTTSLTPQDEGEISLRPKLLADYTGQGQSVRLHRGRAPAQ